MQNTSVHLNLSSDQSQSQSAKHLFDAIQLSQDEDFINNNQHQQQCINMKDYKIKKNKKEKKKLKKYKKKKQIKQKIQVAKMKIESDEEQFSKQKQENNNMSQNSSQQYEHDQQRESEQQDIKNLNPNQQQQSETSKPKKLIRDSKKWMKQKFIERSTAKKQKIEDQQGFKLQQLGNDGIADSIDEDDDSFSQNQKKSKKKGKKAKNIKQKKQKLTNEELLKKLGEIGCEQEEQQLDSQRYNIDSGISNVQRMKNKKEQKKSIKVQNKLFGDLDFDLDKENGQMPPPPQQNLQLQIKPKNSQCSISSAFLSKIQTIKKNRGLQANVDEAEFQKINKEKNKRSINKLVNRLNDELQKDEDIDLMVRVPSFSRGKSADIINNTLYIKTYSQSQNNKIEENKEQIAQNKKEYKQIAKNTKNKTISRSQFYKNIKTDVQLRRSKYISNEQLINNIKKTGLEQLQQIRKKIQQKKRKQAMIELGQFDEAEDYIQQLQQELNQKGISKQQIRKLIQLEEGIEDVLEEPDENEKKQKSQQQVIKQQSKKINKSQIQQEDKKSNCSKKISSKSSEKNFQKMDIQQPDLIEQFQDEDQKEIKDPENEQEQELQSQNSQEQEFSSIQNLSEQNQKQQENQQKQQQNQDNEEMIKLKQQQEKRKKQLEQMQQEGIGIKKRFIIIENISNFNDKIKQNEVQSAQKQNVDFNIIAKKKQINLSQNQLKMKEHIQEEQNLQSQIQNKQDQVIQPNQNQQQFKQFKKLRKIATIIAQKRQKREQELRRAKDYFQQQAELGSDNQDHDQIVKKINKNDQDDQYDGADLDQQLQELIDNAIDINEENQMQAFKKYMQQQKQRDREQLQKILRGQFKRKQIDIQMEQDEKNRLQRMEKMMEWIQKQEQDQAGLYAKQSESESEDSYYGYKTHRKKHKPQQQSEQEQQQNQENKEELNKKLQMYLEDSISPNKNKYQKFQFNIDLINSIPKSNLRQKSAISLNGSKKTSSSASIQQGNDKEPPKFSANSLFGGLLNLTGPSKNLDKSNYTGPKLKKTSSHMNQYLKKTISQNKKGNQGIKLPAMFNKAISVKK